MRDRGSGQRSRHPLALHCRRREGVLNQGAEFPRAKAAGFSDEHIVAEIGQVLAGEIEGRRSAEEITVYKSLGTSSKTWRARGRSTPSMNDGVPTQE